MSDLKPKVFIGSSTGGLKIARKVKAYLSSACDCHVWNEKGIWEVNRSTFDNLLGIATFFDFGVFVATADDLTLTSNDNLVIEPRDNVILEMALFLGTLGRHKSFLLVEQGIKLPSDFNGIFMPRFSITGNKSLRAGCSELTSHIKEHYLLGHLSLYPTTALSIGYYKNFVEGMVESIHLAEKLEFNGSLFTDFRLKIVMPKNLKGNIRQKGALFYKRNKLSERSLETKYRKHPTWFHLDAEDAPNAVMYDMPSTLTGIDVAIEMILRKDFLGRTEMQEIIEERELNNFRRVLQIQLDQSDFAREVVEIVDEF